MRWPASTIEALDTGATAARAGFGKSTLLREAVLRLGGFHTLRAFGEESAQDDRFQLLQEWRADAAPRHTLQATRLLRQLTGPSPSSSTTCSGSTRSPSTC